MVLLVKDIVEKLGEMKVKTSDLQCYQAVADVENSIVPLSSNRVRILLNSY